MTERAFHILMAALYLLPLPVLWLGFFPATAPVAALYVVITIWGLWNVYKAGVYAYRAEAQ